MEREQPVEITHELLIYVRVPGGGDWSNTDLDIDNSDTPLVVKWTTTRETEG